MSLAVVVWWPRRRQDRMWRFVFALDADVTSGSPRVTTYEVECENLNYLRWFQSISEQHRPQHRPRHLRRQDRDREVDVRSVRRKQQSVDPHFDWFSLFRPFLSTSFCISHAMLRRWGKRTFFEQVLKKEIDNFVHTTIRKSEQFPRHTTTTASSVDDCFSQTNKFSSLGLQLLSLELTPTIVWPLSSCTIAEKLLVFRSLDVSRPLRIYHTSVWIQSVHVTLKLNCKKSKVHGLQMKKTQKCRPLNKHGA